jgi:E3 ubiquitin-protein ligase RNF13
VPIKNRADSRDTGRKAFVLIARGNCSFEDKVQEAQRVGFDAAVVYDDEEKASLYSSEWHHYALLPIFLLFAA